MAWRVASFGDKPVLDMVLNSLHHDNRVVNDKPIARTRPISAMVLILNL
jgi:hypothetical protein